MSAQTDFVYITSPSYSGSTLLTFLLATHPRIATVGELKAQAMGNIEEYYCSCGTRFPDCIFWQRLVDRLQENGVALDLQAFESHFHLPGAPLSDRLLRATVRGPGLEKLRDLGLAYWPPARRKRDRALARNVALVDAICTVQGGDVFLDGSKDPIRLKHLYQHGPWNMKVISMIRDGRGAANSWMKHYHTDMATAAREWKDNQLECERMVNMLPAEDCYPLYYEELCRYPDEKLAEIFRFIGLDPDQANRDFLAVENHIIGNSMRLKSSSEIVLDEKWRTRLTPDDLKTFETIAGDLNQRYGYPAQ